MNKTLKTSDLEPVLLMNGIPASSASPVVHDNARIIAAGPITKQPMTVAFRYVLAVIEAPYPFVVWVERFPEFPFIVKSDVASGKYFPVDGFADAVKYFGMKVADSGIASIYRDLEAK